MQLARSLITMEPANISRLGLQTSQIINNLSDYGQLCPIEFVSKNVFDIQGIRSPNCYLANLQIYLLTEHGKEDMEEHPMKYLAVKPPKSQNLPSIIMYENVSLNSYKICVGKLDPVELFKGKDVKCRPHLIVKWNQKFWGFSSSQNLLSFFNDPNKYEKVVPRDKMEIQKSVFNKSEEVKIESKEAYLENVLSQVIMRALAELGYRKLKYPTISTKETALKFIAICLKATNENQSSAYRAKYKEKLNSFLKHCNFSKAILSEAERKGFSIYKEKLSGLNEWKEWDEENLLKNTAEFADFMKNMNAMDKVTYFYSFLR